MTLGLRGHIPLPDADHNAGCGRGNPLKRNKAHRRRQRGQSLVEFSLVLPIFVILVMGIADFGLGLKTWITMTNSVREAARYGAIGCASGDVTTSDVQQRTIDAATGLDVDMSDVTVTNCTVGASTESVVVTLQYEYKLITPLGGIMSFFGGGIPSSLDMSSSADMRME